MPSRGLELSGREQRFETFLVLGDPRLRLAQSVLAGGRQVELLATAIVVRSFANQQAALLVAVDDRHHRRTIHAERSRHRYLRQHRGCC